MTAQIILTALLLGIFLYAWQERRRSPVVATLSLLAASSGAFLVWVPTQATSIAELVGIGRGVDLIIYIWIVISLLILFNLHLKLRVQLELTTALARQIALGDAIASADAIISANVAVAVPSPSVMPQQAPDRTI